MIGVVHVHDHQTNLSLCGEPPTSSTQIVEPDEPFLPDPEEEAEGGCIPCLRLAVVKMRMLNDECDELVDEYNELVDEYNVLVDDYNTEVGA